MTFVYRISKRDFSRFVFGKYLDANNAKIIKIINPVILYLNEITAVESPTLVITKLTKNTNKASPTVQIENRLIHNWSKSFTSVLVFINRYVAYPNNHTTKSSFQDQTILQNDHSRPSLNVTNVWRKNCNNNPIKNILQTTISVSLNFRLSI